MSNPRYSRAACAAGMCALAGAAGAALIDTRNEFNLSVSKNSNGVLGANEYGPGNNQSYAGQGGGFGGAVGSGTTYMAADTSNWYVAFNPASALNDIYVIQFAVNGAGIVNQATHGDNLDGGRSAATLSGNQSAAPFPISVGYALVMGNFGTVLFRYNATTPAGQLDFIQYDGSAWNTTGASGSPHEVAIPWSNIGLGGPASRIDWFGYYSSGNAYLSNEGVPRSPQYAGPPADSAGNIGFGNPLFPVIFADYNRFTTPAPGAAALLALGGLAAARRCRL